MVMGVVTFTLVFLIAVALFFDFINGMHDSANSIATIVSTRVLTSQHSFCSAPMWPPLWARALLIRN
jgi:phosphate/sulfate permease